MNWEITTNRFVAFFDVLGFKDLVAKNKHGDILNHLKELKEVVTALEQMKLDKKLENRSKLKLATDQTRSATFSDSIVIFSKADSEEDLCKVLFDSMYVFTQAIANGLAIKGSISYGEMTVDFENSLFFGQPLIDAYLLHEELAMLGVILDHNAETKKNEFNHEFIGLSTGFDKVPMKYGKVNHTFLTTYNSDILSAIEESLKKLYNRASGKPRTYIDNSREFYSHFVQTASGVFTNPSS